MILLREYNVSADGKWLTIDVQANPSLAGVYITSIRLSCTGKFDTEDKSADLFDKIINGYGEDFPGTINEYTGEVIDWEMCPDEVRFKIDVSMFHKPFHLLVTAEDPLHSATTCAHKSTLEAVTFYMYPLYKEIACAVKKVDPCHFPHHLTDLLMRFMALTSSIAVGDKDSINGYFEWLVLHGKIYPCGEAIPQGAHSAGCGCHS